MEREAATDTVVLIHGLWMTPLSWEHWVTRYEQRGLKVITPGYPGIQPGTAGVQALRDDPSPLAGLGVTEVFDHLKHVIAGLDTKPIIMGHSFGGAFVQLLLDAGYGSAGVSIDGAAVKGIKSLPFSEIKATFPVLKNPANKSRAVPITEKEFHYAFTNNLTDEESKAVYNRYSVPVSGRILFQGGFANFTRARRRPTTSPTTTAPRCCSSPAATTTSCRPPCSARTTRRTPSARRRSPPTSSSTAAATTPAASPAGKPSPTSPSTGPSPPTPETSTSADPCPAVVGEQEPDSEPRWALTGP
ncbi:alpha/beta fold hydrolase [Streptomyces sp. NPDC050803]|uniref:alpha/beta hydrolase n=1 Tax=unclassified Streptomyces TaxID=2593676 RepID=UPI0034278D4E